MSTVQLTWTDNSGGGQTFRVYRSITSSYAGFSEIESNATSPYDDESLADDQYWYYIIGNNGSKDSDPSNVVTITTTT